MPRKKEKPSVPSEILIETDWIPNVDYTVLIAR